MCEENPLEFRLLKMEGGRVWWWEYGIHPYSQTPAYLNHGGTGFTASGDEDVLETTHAERWRDLDWSKTDLVAPNSESGWLDREGRFYGCPYSDHDNYAYYVLHKEEIDLENSGWVRVWGKGKDPEWTMGYRPGLRLSVDQRIWLDRNDYTLYEWD